MQVSLSKGRNQDPEGGRGAGSRCSEHGVAAGYGPRDPGAGTSGCNVELRGGVGLLGFLLKFPSFSFLFLTKNTSDSSSITSHPSLSPILLSELFHLFFVFVYLFFYIYLSSHSPQLFWTTKFLFMSITAGQPPAEGPRH